MGLDFARIVHGDQYLRILRPLDPAAEIIDKGEGKGARLYICNEFRRSPAFSVGQARVNPTIAALADA